jgi:trigger factor
LIVNVTVQELSPCKKLVRVEVDAAKVDETLASVTKEYQRQAALPGFRPGKAPVAMVIRRYEKPILDEAKRKLISDSYKQAVDDQKLDVVGYPDIEEIQFGRGQPLQFAATVETAPDFELPEYKGLPAEREARTVTDEDVQKALDTLREARVSFKTVERPVQTGDIAVVSYSGVSEGKPITEIAPTAKGLTEQKNFWLEVGSNSFIPGFADQLLGTKAGDHRTVQVDFPADFVTPQLAGKKGTYEVDVVEVKEKVLPSLDDTFATSYGAESLEKLRAGVRADLEKELAYKQNRSIRNQVVRHLLDKVDFEVPEGSLNRETRNVVFDLVRENQKRGASRETIEQHKDQIYAAANANAKERVKAAFLMRKIAEKEDIKVSEQEVRERILQLSNMYEIPPEKFLADLQQRDGIMEIYDQLANEKVINVLQEHAKIQDVAPGSGSAEPPASPAQANPS